MAEYTYEQLKGMTVSDLREVVHATGNEDRIEGYATMHKDHLLPALCDVLGLHEHHVAAGAGKTRLKTEIRDLRTQRDAATDKATRRRIRRRIHKRKHQLRRMAT